MDIRNPLHFTLSTSGEWHVHMQAFNLIFLETHKEYGMSGCSRLHLRGYKIHGWLSLKFAYAAHKSEVQHCPSWEKP